MIWKLLSGASAFALIGCASTSNPPPRWSTPVVESQGPNIVGRWSLVRVDEVSVASAKVILVFESDGAYRRQVSCNQGLGTYRLSGRTLSLSAVGETERGCDPFDHAALVDEAVRVGPWTASNQGNDLLLLDGRHRLLLRRAK